MKLLIHLNSNVKLFGADALKNKIKKRFLIKKEKLKELFKSGKTSKISFTTDIWTSPANVPFMTVTASFIYCEGMIKVISLICI